MFGETGKDQGKGAKAPLCLGVATTQAQRSQKCFLSCVTETLHGVAPSLPSASANSLKSVPARLL